MTQVSGPWNGSILGDAITNAPYSSAFWAGIWRDLMQANGPYDGVLVGSGIAPDAGLVVQQTSPASANVQVTPGAAIVYGRWYRNDSTPAVLAIAANASGNPRIDRVVLHLDPTLQTIRLLVLQGTPAGVPAAPGITQVAGGIWEILLARIAVANGFATITDANITPEWTPGGAAEGVYLANIQNRSGADLEHGDLVIWDTANNRAVTTTTTPGVPIAGVWQGFTGALGYGRLLVDGVGLVKTPGAVARGAKLIQSTTAKKATAATVSDENAFGIALAAAVNNYALARIHSHIEQLKYNTCIYYLPVGLYQDDTGNWVDVDGTNVKATGFSHTGRIKVGFIFTGGTTNTNNPACYRIKNQTTGAVTGDATAGLVSVKNTQGANIKVEWIFTALTPGTVYEFRLQQKIYTGGAGDNTQVQALPIIIMAEEL